MLSCCSQSPERRNSITRGEQPTVFSLKSRRSFPARPPVGGEYEAIFWTALRGTSAPVFVVSFMAAYLGRTRVRFQTFGARQFRDGRSQTMNAPQRTFLPRDNLHETRRG